MSILNRKVASLLVSGNNNNLRVCFFGFIAWKPSNVGKKKKPLQTSIFVVVAEMIEL